MTAFTRNLFVPKLWLLCFADLASKVNDGKLIHPTDITHD